jgi:hypothetical protein
MMRVRLFSSRDPVGFIGFDEAKHRIRPQGVLTDDCVELIRKALEAGGMSGHIGAYQWYRQATPFCPLDSAKLCPCDDEVCGADAIPRAGGHS